MSERMTDERLAENEAYLRGADNPGGVASSIANELLVEVKLTREKPIATEIVQRARVGLRPDLEAISFFCPGVPVPKGSMRGFTRKGGGVGMEEGNADRVRPWMHTLAWEARAAGCSAAEGPVTVGLTFWFPRSKAHFTPKGVLKASAPRFHVTKPDVDKLSRACLDALAHVAFADDARVVALDPAPWKHYADAEHPPGARIVVRRLA